MKGVAGVDAAVVELDALPDAVGAGAQDHDARAVAAGDFASPALVGLVVVGRRAGEFGRAGVDGLEDGHDAERLAVGAHVELGGAGKEGDFGIGKPVALGDPQGVGVDVGQGVAAEGFLYGDHIGHAIDEEAIDARLVAHLLGRAAATQGLAHVEDALGGRAAAEVVEPVFVEGDAVGTQALVLVFHRAQGLAQGLFEGTADCHDLAHGLHAGRQGVVGAFELFEGETGDLDDAIVD